MKKVLPIVVISVLFIACLTLLFSRQEERLLSNNDNRLCLNAELDKNKLSDNLIHNAYVETKEDASFISSWLVDSLFRGRGMQLPNLGSLNSRDFQIPVYLIEKYGGEGLKRRLYMAYKDLGCDSVSLRDYEKCPANLKASDSTCTITVQVTDNKRHLFTKGGVEGIHVRLKQHKKSIDPLNKRPVEEDHVVAYAQTNSDGEVTFNVQRGGFYSVLPINRGYEYGLPKGTTHGKSIGDEKSTFTFTQKEHRIRLFDKSTYARIKADNSFSVRSVSDYVTELVKIATIFLLAWWCTFFFIRWRDNKLIQINNTKYQCSDSSIVSILMLLNAICLFMMLAITNPLIDRDYANEMIWGTLFGCAGLCVFSYFDYVKYYSDLYKLKFDVVSKWLKRKVSDKVPEGIGFLLIALSLVVLLGIFGTGPEGSTAKVNLWFFQPSEISKFFFVAAIALFFTANASRIQDFARGHFIKAQFRTLIWVIISVLILLLLYVGLISDMGPALVLAITFIIMYSIVRQDLLQMFLGVFSYLIVLYLANYLISIDNVNTIASNKLIIVLNLSLLWGIVWFGGGYFWKKRIYESAGFMNLLILLFTHGGELLNLVGLPNQGQRLMDRISASGDGIWDNTVRGGDQVAQGIWALASGGFWGQGLGNGNANLVPAFHTDMIFESIGEVMGFWVLLAILVCYALLIRKCLIRSKEAGHPFLFYLIAGIAIVTVVQLFVIIMGSLGIVPLTGVSLPFLSYGKAGLVINLAAFGIVIGMSRNNPTIQQKSSIVGYHNVIKSGISVFFLLFAVVTAYAFNYQVISRDTYLTKAAYITNLAGEHFPEQNPRISVLLRNIQSGNIYDRNGVLLATSNPDSLLLYKEKLVKAGIDKKIIDSLSHTSKRRYYPFGDHLFFMLGDMNTRNLSHGVFSKNPYGYLAEERHIDSLRGFSIPTQKAFITKVLRISPYLPDSVYKDDWQVPLYGENQTIINMLKDGVNGNLVKQWNENRAIRDIKLTIDAKLQMNLQNALRNNAKLLNDKYSRVSLVILNAESGDLLCSANYPLPNQDQIVSLFDKRQYTYRPETSYGRYTERDLGLTFQSAPGSTAKIISSAAGLNKKGKDATKSIYIYKQERIHRSGSYPEPDGNVNMRDAIVKSSNCFYVNLVHKERLYNELAPLYLNTGIGVGEYVPYMFNISELSDSVKNIYLQGINDISSIAYKKYDDYINKRGGKNFKVMNFPDCAMSWGQGVMIASPLNMARMVSIVANKGKLTSTRYLYGDRTNITKCMETSNSNILEEYMRAESMGHPATQYYAQHIGMGGKTGTPTRTISNRKNKNDGWYVCFFNSKEGKLALALRIEQCGSSAVATKWINQVIMPALSEIGYVKY